MIDPRLSVIKKRFKDINKIIAVSGGKGGIGKSLTAAALAINLSKAGFRVGLLDLDFCGPCGHIILGMNRAYPQEDKGLIPPEIDGVKFMSLVYFSESNPAPLRGSEVSNAIIEMLAITLWSQLDYLILDMPPGIGDSTLDIIRLIPEVRFLLVTIPSKVALEVLKKELAVLNELGIPVVGILLNMKTAGSPAAGELEKLPAPLIGVLDYDKKLESAVGKPTAIYKTRFAGQLREIIGGVDCFGR